MKHFMFHEGENTTMSEMVWQGDDREFQSFLSQVKELGGEKLLTSLHTLPILRLIFDAQCFTRERAQPTVLNIFASKDDSGFRENVYKPLFEGTRYTTVDFWQDKFICDGTILPNSYTLPFLDDSFDAVITTKVLLEHISEPAETIRELARVLKPRGEAFVIAPFAMVIHQEPYDFFRYTEYGLQHLFKKAGLEVIYIRPTLSGFMTTVDAFMLFNFYGLFPGVISRRLKRYSKRWLIPFATFLDRRIPDQRRFCRHYICRVRKPEL
jgi:SAM-dependent methyltransferase